MSRSIRTEGDGLWLNWKVVLAVLAFFISSGALWTTLGLAKLDDIKTHDRSRDAHPVEVPGFSTPVGITTAVESIALVRTEVDAIKRDVAATTTDVAKVRDGFYDQRAEDLAYRAVDQMPRSATARQRIQRFERVKSTAKANLEKGLDARAGLDSVVGF